MPVKRETQEYVKEELPYLILKEIYKNSRVSLQELGRKLDISYHTIAITLKDLENRYQIEYTLELDEIALGFTEGRLITIKFEKAPPIDFLKARLEKDVFVQDAYLSTGDFDLFLYVVGETAKDLIRWVWNLRTDLVEYKPIFKSATLDARPIGFLPLRNNLINESNILSKTEKNVLTLLNANSRIKLRQICDQCKIKNPMRVVYIIRKLKEKGIIKRFVGLTQKSTKRIFSASTVSLMPTKEHSKLLLSLAKEITKEDLHEITNDYCFSADTSGSFDGFDIGTFENGEHLSRRGPDLLQRLWAVETPKIEKSILTDCIIGRWPFHLEEYESYQKIMSKENKTFDVI